VRRIAARIYGSKPETVTVDQAGFISVAWFGSLAVLAASVGPLTALVALSLQNIAPREERTRVGPLTLVLSVLGVASVLVFSIQYLGVRDGILIIFLGFKLWKLFHS
jgi:hypothetical protein